jgi:MYXO-CTERM domain-containing protein
MSFSGLRASSVRLASVSLSLLLCRAAAAQVIEPNGTAVPAPTTDPISLQQYFTSQNENINAVKDAAVSPAVFLPLCDFQATLVLQQSQAMAGLAWYNVPTSPTAAPIVYPVGTPPLTVGATVTSSDIRSDPNYANGLIGFALTRNNGTGTPYLPVYYSEYMRNVDCTGCTMPGYWKMALSYQSTVTANAYYLAWEDWPGADQSSWQGNDGDFNDQVFKFTGVTCNGGGVPCNTGMQGVCSLGVTQCQGDGTIVCKPTVTASPEKCDNLDNDCNGQVDDGTGLCPGTEVCMQGTCTGACGTQEFACQPNWECQDGLCVDPKCVGVTCEVGQICRAGTCVGGCDGVTCPLGQECQLGVCIDPCATVTCNGSVCDHGACVTVCSCQPCGAGQVCTNDGHCVDTGCDVLTCGAGQVCQAGACIDACTGAVCPGGADCHNGVCDMPSTGQNTSGTGGVSGAAGTTGSGSGGAAGHAGTTGSPHGGAGGGTTTSGTGGQTTTGGGPHEAGGEVSCSCETGGAGRGGLGLLAALFALASFRRRHRRLQGAPRA